ncbi:hypothetical protein CEXT_555201 [Caerostris extrusa]|uniref:Uncharacterized protein n=1 Tax=Caerostris extrusa TaxID=172846 RepID=A0AAV4Y084_CAEEX|nr:hypothetical protein CEXT_555201 [Caerostris extrusa]
MLIKTKPLFCAPLFKILLSCTFSTGSLNRNHATRTQSISMAKHSTCHLLQLQVPHYFLIPGFVFMFFLIHKSTGTDKLMLRNALESMHLKGIGTDKLVLKGT